MRQHRLSGPFCPGCFALADNQQESMWILVGYWRSGSYLLESHPHSRVVLSSEHFLCNITACPIPGGFHSV